MACAADARAKAALIMQPTVRNARYGTLAFDLVSNYATL